MAVNREVSIAQAGFYRAAVSSRMSLVQFIMGIAVSNQRVWSPFSRDTVRLYCISAFFKDCALFAIIRWMGNSIRVFQYFNSRLASLYCSACTQDLVHSVDGEDRLDVSLQGYVSIFLLQTL